MIPDGALLWCKKEEKNLGQSPHFVSFPPTGLRWEIWPLVPQAFWTGRIPFCCSPAVFTFLWLRERDSTARSFYWLCLVLNKVNHLDHLMQVAGAPKHMQKKRSIYDCQFQYSNLATLEPWHNDRNLLPIDSCPLWYHNSFLVFSSIILSRHQRHHSVNVEYSHLQVQFTPTEILKLLILFLFSSSFCLKYSLHFTGQSKFCKVIQSRLLVR